MSRSFTAGQDGKRATRSRDVVVQGVTNRKVRKEGGDKVKAASRSQWRLMEVTALDTQSVLTCEEGVKL